MRWSTSSIILWLLALAVLASGAGHAQSTTASAPSVRTRALLDIGTSQASSLEAVPASVDESLDMEVQADVQEVFRDPSLTGLGTGEADARVKGFSSSSDEVRSLSAGATRSDFLASCSNYRARGPDGIRFFCLPRAKRRTTDALTS